MIKIVIIFTLQFCIYICKVKKLSYFWLRNKTWRLLPPTLLTFHPHPRPHQCLIMIMVTFLIHSYIYVKFKHDHIFGWKKNTRPGEARLCFNSHLLHDHLWSSIYENLQHTTRPSLWIEQNLIEAKLSFFVFHCGLIELCASGSWDGGASDWDVSYKEFGPTVHRAARAASNKI